MFPRNLADIIPKHSFSHLLNLGKLEDLNPIANGREILQNKSNAEREKCLYHLVLIIDGNTGLHLREWSDPGQGWSSPGPISVSE